MNETTNIGLQKLVFRFTNRKKLTSREQCLVTALAFVGLLAALLWRPIQQLWLTKLVLQADTPSESVIHELVDRDRDFVVLLNRLWQTERIPHRLAVLNYLKVHGETNAMLLAAMESVLLAAAQDGDIEARELGLVLLAANHHPDLLLLAKSQLRDADPAVRVLGLQYLGKAGNAQAVPCIVPLLDDPDPRVVAVAGNTLRRLTGQDFGIRLSQAIPEFKNDTLTKATPAGTVALAQGVQKWKTWWKLHEADYPQQPATLQRPASTPRSPAPDLSLEDANGKRIRLSDFRGKQVILNFWDTATPGCLVLVSNLVKVQRRHPQSVTVLGISLDSTAPERDHEHEHAHGGKPHHQPELAKIRAQLEQFIQNQGINYPVLIDANGSVGRRFKADELPTSVLIDSAGRLRRRFIGGRSLETLTAMLKEVESPQTTPR